MHVCLQLFCRLRLEMVRIDYFLKFSRQTSQNFGLRSIEKSAMAT